MKITIHRGTQEIGGTCIQVTSGGRSILLDAGLPLRESKSLVDLSRIDFDAVIISHSHQDHYGLIESLDDSVPVYIGEIGAKMIAAARTFTRQAPLQNNFRHFKSWEWFEFAPFRIKPYLMDHSSVDAFGFLIEANGKRLFYSGDFRSHGSKEAVFERFVSSPPKGIDLLLMEGTMMGREGDVFKRESDLEHEMYDVLKGETGPAFLICSGQHVDRLCTAYRACKRAGRIFVVDIYTAWIMQELKFHFDSTPHFGWDDIRVLAHGGTASGHYRAIAGRPEFMAFLRSIYLSGNVIDADAIARNPQQYFIKSSRVDLLLRSLKPSRCSLIYSQWQGYLEEEFNDDAWKLTQLRDHPSVDFHIIHTSGHAFKHDLKRYAEAIGAKMLVPVHTERGDQFCEFTNVSIKQDGESFELGEYYESMAEVC